MIPNCFCPTTAIGSEGCVSIGMVAAIDRLGCGAAATAVAAAAPPRAGAALTARDRAETPGCDPEPNSRTMVGSSVWARAIAAELAAALP
jgi:hypothetical protein